MIAQCGVYAQRCAQFGQVRLHVFGFVSGGVVVHDVAGQQDDVGFFLLHDAGQFVELARAEQDAQVKVAGYADTQRFGQRLVQYHAVVVDGREIGVVERQAE